LAIKDWLDDERDVQLGRMKLECAWHPKLFGVELVMRPASPGREKDGVSHGICEECRAITAGEADEELLFKATKSLMAHAPGGVNEVQMRLKIGYTRAKAFVARILRERDAA
jgi:hypothetical protein